MGQTANPLGALTEDLQKLRNVLDSDDTSIDDKNVARGRIAQLEKYLGMIDDLRREADASGFAALASSLSTQALCWIIADCLTNERPVIQQVAEAVAQSVRNELSTSGSSTHIANRLRILLSHAVVEEFCTRQGDAEDGDGRQVRELVVERQEFEKRLVCLADGVAGSLYFPGDFVAGRDDAKSQAAREILGRIVEFRGDEPAENPMILEAFAEGALNSVLDKSRDALREQIRTDLRRSSHIVPLSVAGDFTEGDSRPIIELLPKRKSEGFCGHDQLLVEQLMTKVDLTPLERSVVKLVMLEERTQDEAAQCLAVNRATVSRNLHKAVTKLRL